MTDTTKSKSSFWKLLKKDWNSNYIIFLIVWALACLLFSKPINLIFGKLGSFLFLDDMDSLVFYQWSIFALILLYLGFRIWYRFGIQGMIYPLFVILTPLVVWYLINCSVSLKPKIDFLNFPLSRKTPLISSLLVIWFIELGFAIWSYLKKEVKIRSNHSSFITDIALDPLDNEQEDLLGFENFAHRIANETMNITSLESVVFGINGEWGEGKTSMINMIRQKLEVEKYTVVDFHPWKTNSGKAITNLFFDILKEGLKGKIAGINWKINSYAEALLNLDQSGFGKTLWQLFFPGDSVEKQKEKLAKSMRRLDKNLIVIVDDLDRLAKNEISDVLKLMRDTANFPNLVFIAAYDRYYLNEAIKSEINPYKAKSYMDKIVLWEAQIYKPQPRRYLSVLRNYLKVSLNDYSEVIDEICQIEQDKILKEIHDSSRAKNSELKNIENIETPFDIHSSIFTNLRTVKKFVNDFVFNFRIVKDNIVFKDFYYLFLLHYFFSDYYTEFVKSFHELYRINNGYPGKINTNSIEYWNLMKLSPKLKIESSSALPKEIISNILDPSVHISPNSIIYYQNFPIYFHLGNYDDITMSEFASLLKADNYQTFKDKVKIILKDKKIIPLFAFQLIIDAHRSNFEFNDFYSVLEFSKELIWLAIKIDASGFYQECHRRLQVIVESNWINIDNLPSELMDFFKREGIEESVQRFISQIIYEYKETGKKKFYLDIDESILLAQENFKNHIKATEEITLLTISLFYCSYQKLNNKREFENDTSIIEIMRKCADLYPDGFIKYLIVKDGTWPTKDKNTFVHRFNVLLLTVFIDLNDLKQFLIIEKFKQEKGRAKVYLRYAIEKGFENSDLTITKQFDPEDEDNNLFSNTFTFSFTLEDLKLGEKFYLLNKALLVNN